MGAIGNKDHYFRYYLAPEGLTTCYETVKDYFINLNEERSLHGVVIVLDKHPAHSNDTVRLLESMESIVLKLPTSTSIFNPVEMCWAWMKH